MASKLITMVRNLQQRKGRKRSPYAVAEGIRLVEEALHAQIQIEGAVISPALSKTRRGAELAAALAAHAVLIEETSERAFGQLADTDTPQGVIAVVEPPKFTLEHIVPKAGSPVLVVDGVQDPGNLGALLRTAYALGVPGVILLTGTADASNAKVLRAAMGASFRLPVVRATDRGLIAWAERAKVTIWVTSSEGTHLDRARPPARLAVVVGNEGAGVRAEVEKLAHRRVAIPLARGAESLNVAVAAGIFLYEVKRAG